MQKASWLENSWHGCSISICSHTEYAYTLGAGAHIHFSNWRPWCEPRDEKTNAAKKGFRSNSVSEVNLLGCTLVPCNNAHHFLQLNMQKAVDF